MSSIVIGGQQGAPALVQVTDPNGNKVLAAAAVLVTQAGELVDLSGIFGAVDGLEALVGTTNTTLATIGTYTDTLESLLASTNGYVDGLEGLLGSQATAANQAIQIAAEQAILAKIIAAPATAANQAAEVASLANIDTKMGLLTGTGEYEAAAAGATDQVMGATGAAGDYLSHIVIQPATTSPGAVTVKDGTTVIFTFTGGAVSVSNLDPITVPLGFYSVSGAFKVSTGANVACLGVGNFT